VLSLLRATGAAGTLEVGGSLGDYRRDHFLFIRPDLRNRVYSNHGDRGEQSAFARASRDAGRWTLLADAQLRRSSFAYTPDPVTGAELGSIAWTFFNPRAGVTFRPAAGWSSYAFYGRTSREPARNDLFAGFDDVGAAEAEFIGSLRRVRPETVHDLEAGASYRTPALSLRANAFLMRFRNEIAPIGELSYIGLPLRKNVPRSSRAGVELEGRLGAEEARLQGGGTLALIRARIDSYTDDASGVTYHDVHPLLTPPLLARGWAELRATPRLRLGAAAQYTSAAFLANDDDRRFMTPAALVLDAHAALSVRTSELMLEVNNLTSAKAYTSGYSDGSSRYFFPVAPAHLTVTLRQRF
jgi:iron complex outermembrane receptor protein